MVSTIRFKSPYVVFRIAGRPISVGGMSRFQTDLKELPVSQRERGRKTFKEYDEAKKNNKIQLTNLVRLNAKMAAAQQGWKITDQPIYIIVTIYSKPPLRFKGEARKTVLKNGSCAGTPIAHNSLITYIKMLKGVLFENESQVACGLVLKRYTDKEECVDILVGKPKNFEEMIYDIRNN